MPPSALFHKGFSFIYVILVVFLIAILLVNGLRSIVNEEEALYGPSPSPSPLLTSCCETSDCSLIDPEITFQGKKFKLIKKDIALSEGFNHMRYSGLTPDGREIFISDTQLTDHSAQCDQTPGEEDLLFGTQRCVPIPNDSLIYVCKDNCLATNEDKIYDAYWQSDPVVPIPDSIKNCSKQVTTGGAPGTYIVENPNPLPPSQQNLQLRKVVEQKVGAGAVPWLSPWCKPAIYLYPKQKSFINVKVNTVGKMILTIPKYPVEGWSVLANPDGKINHIEGDFDYLYYEAEIPDEKIEIPQKGFVKKLIEVEGLLKKILPQAGLNEKETNQFISYWLEVLPKEVPYYFIGIVSTQNLDQLASLEITPSPNKIIRVTIYFQALEGPINVEEPIIDTPKRGGFTVVEWGGIFKKDPKYPFSCFM
jgi:hypothetical protein